MQTDLTNGTIGGNQSPQHSTVTMTAGIRVTDLIFFYRQLFILFLSRNIDPTMSFSFVHRSCTWVHHVRPSSRNRCRTTAPASATLSRSLQTTTRQLARSASQSSSSAPDRARTVSRLPAVPDDCHRFILMRHGQSSFNDAAIFTGWCDVALTRRGVVEALEAGEVFRSHNLQFRKCYTSLLTRSIVTAHRSLEAAGVAFTPLQLDWRFNVSSLLLV